MRSKIFAIFNILLSLTGLATIAVFSSYYVTKGPRQLLNLPKVGAAAQSPKAKFNPIVMMEYPNHSRCTAVVFDASYAVTAAHCVQDMPSGKLSTETLKIYLDGGADSGVTAIPAGYSDRLDFGIITGDFSKFQQVEVAYKYNGFFTGQRFITCGFAFGQKDMSCTPFIPTRNYVFHMRGVGSLVPGMSGGPVFDVDRGSVVAINSQVGDGVVEVVPLFGLYGAFDLEK